MIKQERAYRLPNHAEAKIRAVAVLSFRTHHALTTICIAHETTVCLYYSESDHVLHLTTYRHSGHRHRRRGLGMNKRTANRLQMHGQGHEINATK